jgi:hypothetical protein
MATDIIHTPTAKTVDLTGLPEPVVREVHRLIQQARQKLAEEAGTSANGAPAPKAGVDGRPSAMGNDPFPRFISDPKPTPEQFSQLLDEMASMGTGKALPPDFSRADVYDDHD